MSDSGPYFLLAAAALRPVSVPLDIDGDGAADGDAYDSNGDGILDVIVWYGTPGTSSALLDTNGDGQPDAVDTNRDGTAEAYACSTGGLTTGANCTGSAAVIVSGGLDTNGDGVPDLAFETTTTTAAGGATVPGTPESVNASAGSAKVTITFAAVSGEEVTYNIYRKNATGVTKSNADESYTGLTGTSHVLTLPGGVQQYFVVSASTTAGESSISAEVSATPTVPTTLRIFRRSVTNTGSMGGLSGANSLCNGDALRPDTSKTYKALLQDNGALQAYTPYVSSTNGNASIGTTNASATFTGTLGSSLSDTGSNYWTGGSGNNCTNWTSTSGNGGTGFDTTGSTWYIDVDTTCSGALYLICVEQPS